ncbi:MAG TPA: FxLYD domain-containing protein [Thermoanaerobaculia bacterium]
MKQPYAKMALALALLAALPALPANADWLVTREGAQVETRGAWTVKGKLVVFHTADGKLSSLRVADVDLEASRRVTEEAVAAQAQAAAEPDRPAERKKPVRVITDKDVRPAAPAPAEEAAEGEAEAGEEGGETAPASGPGLVIEDWTQASDPEDDHVVITGMLQNASSATSADTKLKIMIFDDTGTLIASSQAALAKAALPPGEKTRFKADFPGYFSFATIKFEPQGRPLARQTAEEPENGG